MERLIVTNDLNPSLKWDGEIVTVCKTLITREPGPQRRNCREMAGWWNVVANVLDSSEVTGITRDLIPGIPEECFKSVLSRIASILWCRSTGHWMPPSFAPHELVQLDWREFLYDEPMYIDSIGLYARWAVSNERRQSAIFNRPGSYAVGLTTTDDPL